MLVYRCAHCGVILADYPQEEIPPCVDHPDGVIEVYDNGDTQPE